MTDNTTTTGLLSPTQPKQSNIDKHLAAAQKRLGQSTSQSKSDPKTPAPLRGSQGQKPQSKPANNAEKAKAVTDLLLGKTQPNQTPDQTPNQVNDQQAAETPQPDAQETDVGPAPDAASGEDAVAVTPPLAAGDLSVKELADHLGTSPKALYEQLKITTGDGETLTLGEVKDRVVVQEAATREIVQRETAITERESATLQNMQLLDTVYNDLKGKLSPEVVQQMQEHTQQQEARERGMLAKVMPELADPNKLDAFRTDAAEFMEPYGFRPNELVIRDHRIALAIKDLIQTKRQLAKLMDFKPEETLPKSRKPQGKRPKPNRHAQEIANARNSSRPQEKAAAVNAILKGAK